jgi:hypothetical protein
MTQITQTVRCRLTPPGGTLTANAQGGILMSIFVDTTTSAWPGAGAFANVARDMARMRRQLLDQTAAERRRRYIVMVLDAAIGQCERRNLAAPYKKKWGTSDLAPPAPVAGLIEQLQLELDREIRSPGSNQEALDVLFDLQRAFLPYSDNDDREEVWG